MRDHPGLAQCVSISQLARDRRLSRFGKARGVCWRRAEAARRRIGCPLTVVRPGKGVKRGWTCLGTPTGHWLIAALVLALYVLVIWMLLEIMFRADFSGGMEIAWIIVALLLAPVAVPVWFLWVRNKDYSGVYRVVTHLGSAVGEGCPSPASETGWRTQVERGKTRYASGAESRVYADRNRLQVRAPRTGSWAG